MKLSQASQETLKKAIQKATSKYAGEESTFTVTDIHLQAILNTDEFHIFNDDEEELATAFIEEWKSYVAEGFSKCIEQDLIAVLNQMKADGEFEPLHIMKPYSFVLVDEEKEVITDLLLIDDDTMLLNDDLLKGLDEELDAFLKELLEK